MKRSIFCVGVALAVAALAAPNAGAVTGCSNDLLTGVYGVRMAGSVSVAGAAKAAAGYARLMMDGAGNLYGNAAASIAGVWSESAVTGEYTVNGDCTFTLTLVDAGEAVQHFDGVLTRTGDAASVLRTDDGAALSGEMARATALCDSASLEGSTMRIRVAGSGDAGAFSSIAVVEINEGEVTASETRSEAGKTTRVASTGTIVVNCDCTVSLSLSAAADTALATYRGVLVNNQREILLVRSDPGMAASGMASAQ